MDGCREPVQTLRIDLARGRKSMKRVPGTLLTLSVLMPIYNQRWTLREIISRALNAPVALPIELVAVDDGSTDGSWELLCEMAKEDPRIRPVRHEKNCGKGTAIRTAIERMTGDVAVIQDADLAYDPDDYPRLLNPIMEGKADAVFGSRFVGNERRVLHFWQQFATRFLTGISNILNNLNLTDMETGYQAVRASILKRLRLQSQRFTLQSELTCRLAQWDARLYEVPISYQGHSSHQGQKARAIDSLKALAMLFRCRFVDPCFTDHSGFYILSAMAKATRYNEWALKLVRQFLGKRILEAGSGIGNLSSVLLDHERLVMVDSEDIYVEAMRQRYEGRGNVLVDQADLTKSADFKRWQNERIDTIVCSNVLEHLEPDVRVLEDFAETLSPGGHCVIVVPAGRWLYTAMDRELGHHRRYTTDELATKMSDAGLQVVYAKRFCRFGALCWAFSGHVMRRRHLSPQQMIWFDRLLPLIKVLDFVLPVQGMSLIMVGRKPVDATKELTQHEPLRRAA